jgi:chromosome segregation ATPase
MSKIKSPLPEPATLEDALKLCKAFANDFLKIARELQETRDDAEELSSERDELARKVKKLEEAEENAEVTHPTLEETVDEICKNGSLAVHEQGQDFRRCFPPHLLPFFIAGLKGETL